MAANKPGKATILAAFFDDGAYSPLFTDGAVSAAYGNANPGRHLLRLHRCQAGGRPGSAERYRPPDR